MENAYFGELFTVRLIDIPEGMASCIIEDIRRCDSLKLVSSRYSGNHRTGTVDFSIAKPMACYYEDNKPVYDTNYRHLATVLCAALGQSLGIYGNMLDPTHQLKSVLMDRMFGFELFNRMSDMLRSVEDNPKTMIVGSESNNILRGDSPSVKLNKLLRYLVRDKFDSIEFTTFGYDTYAGLLTAKFSTLDGLIDMLDIEQFLDTNGMLEFKTIVTFEKGRD